MHFEQSLKKTIYPPWQNEYIDYSKLKALLHDTGSDAGSGTGKDEEEDTWTEQDESAFVEELVNVQLEKVHAFQSSTIQKLRDQTSACEAKLDSFVDSQKEPGEDGGPQEQSSIAEMRGDEDRRKKLQEVLRELDQITKEMNELEKFSRINYTGFLKATKKHDRKRGLSYRVGPLMQVRLAALPFNKEEYSPLLFRLSTMYSFARQNLEQTGKKLSFTESSNGNEAFTAYKFWVHPDNLLELKTLILRRLPVLVYNPQNSRVAEGDQRDPTITSIYFDNPSFSLYNAKVDHERNASSFRLRWYDDLQGNQEIYCEEKTVQRDDISSETRFTTKPKHIQKFLNEDYHMDRDVQKLRSRYGADSTEVADLQHRVSEIKSFIKDKDLQPVLRANYTRSAFQIPGDNRVRITLDTNLALIREDSLDSESPIRDPEEWHRKDIDDLQMEYPFEKIRKGEINRFPYALLEIRIRGDKNYEWVTELMNSHLVKQAPRFSKFVHGVAQLFDDYVNAFPFWLSEVDADIRKDPHQAFEEEQERKAKAAEDEFAVGSLLKQGGAGPLSSSPFKKHSLGSEHSPRAVPAKLHRQDTQKSYASTSPRATAQMTKIDTRSREGRSIPTISDPAKPVAKLRGSDDEEDESSGGSAGEDARQSRRRGIRSLFPGAARISRYRAAKLPPGVEQPTFWIKNEGPLKIEAKVWLANQRTYTKWQHVSILLASLSLGLFYAAGEAGENNVARWLGVLYTVVAVFTSCWGLGVYLWRDKMIRARSGRDLNSAWGPVVYQTLREARGHHPQTEQPLLSSAHHTVAPPGSNKSILSGLSHSSSQSPLIVDQTDPGRIGAQNLRRT
ncbi:MAG: Phosphate metabolism transcription protein [Alyxoria varia]|nr:MAG: Phosphate metabolism transcription protein [Alyxoria varia]